MILLQCCHHRGLARIPVSPAAFYHFLMDASAARHVTIKKCQKTWLSGDRSSSYIEDRVDHHHTSHKMWLQRQFLHGSTSCFKSEGVNNTSEPGLAAKRIITKLKCLNHQYWPSQIQKGKWAWKTCLSWKYYHLMIHKPISAIVKEVACRR